MGCQQLGSAGRQGVNNLKLVKDVQDVSKGFVGSDGLLLCRSYI